MTPTCTECHTPLSQFRLLRQRCRACNTLHVARRGKVPIAAAVIAGLFPFLWVAAFFLLPGPWWVPAIVFPVLLLALAIADSLHRQRWVGAGKRRKND